MPDQVEVLCGKRYRLDDVRPGSGTFDGDVFVKTIVVDGSPISGPVMLMRHDPYETLGLDWWESRWSAMCLECDEETKLYKRKGEPALRSWAHHHRCKTRV